ncbi:amidohydrolase family protein [Algibacter mikhailovii]|uniref:Amidohydrolase 3 domain-containing protein n=1 Tax=Algibacter mikhailovii TaxID=425498 RepID=A0A918QRR0_9FLAO|nr:amidohydrolase family protein [Algibacter mikhailovii]GGZ68357.1 hypothetical protein GCM10007028_01590 [Algibacter mikhailovii]
MKPRISLFLSLLLIFTSCKNEPREPLSDVTDKVSNHTILYHNGTIVTMEGPAGSTVEAVVTEGDKIVYTGDLEAAKNNYPNPSDFDLKGNTMFPGLIEQHLHPFLGALTLSVPVIAPEDWELPDKTWPAAKDHDAYIEALKTEIAKHKNPEITFFTWGYNNFFHGKINKKDLDAISTVVPIGVWHRSAHEFFVNTPFLEKYNISIEDVEKASAMAQAQINLDEGHFFENGAIMYLLPKIVSDLATPERMRFGIKQMVKMLHGNGVTAYNEPGAFVNEEAAAIYREVLGSPETPMYSYFIYEGNTNYTKYGDETLEHLDEMYSLFPDSGKLTFFRKQVKFLADGAIISQLMQMKDGYLDGHEGAWMLEPELLEKGTKLFWDAGYQLHIHVNGDEGLQVVLNTIERRMKENPRKDHRTVIIHFANSTPEQVKKLADLGCIVSANPYYVTGFSEKFSEIGLGPKRAEAMVRLKEVEDLGVSFSLHSDLPMAPSDPLYLAWCAVTRISNGSGKAIKPEMGASLHGALKAITIDAAFSWQKENELGSIKAGKTANFTIMKQNPYTFGAEKLKDIEISGTVFEGRHFPLGKAKKDHDKHLAGGWNVVEIDKDIKDIVTFVLGEMNTTSKLNRILSSKKQVVKGLNYEVIFQLDNNEIWKAKVHRDLNGNLVLLDRVSQN